MVRAGEGEKWLEDFLGNHLVAAGWRKLRDSSGRTLAGLTQGEIHEICAAAYDHNPKTISAHASQVNAFVNSIRGGDFVIVPSDSGKRISVGLVRSEAIENPEVSDSYNAVRNVLWLVQETPIANLPEDKSTFLASPRTVVKTKLSQKNIIDFVESTISKSYWFHLIELGVQSWVFQFNPELWNPSADLKLGYSDGMAMNQGFKEVKCGDTILFREGGSNSGLYSVGHIASDVREIGNNFGDRTISVNYDFLINPCLSKSEIENDIDLTNIATIRGQQFTNRKLVNSEAALIFNYILPRLEEVIPWSEQDVNYWWCNVGVTKKQAIATGKLWAHAASSNGAILTHHTDVKRIKQGDVILLYADKKIVAIGPCIDESIDTTRPPEYPAQISSAGDDAGVPGFQVTGKFEELETPILFEEIVTDLKELVDEKGPLASNDAIKMGYLFPLSREFGEKFMVRNSLSSNEESNAGTSKEEASMLAERLHLTPNWVEEIMGIIRESRQVIFYGPPGTGKTFIIQALASAIATEENVELIQFHPSFSYEDFFEGYRPKSSEDGKSMIFEKSPGPLRRMADRADANPDELFILVIDEINRGNLAKVFGELYFLLEYRDKAVELMYSNGEKFTLPKNLILLGTMNTADKSIANLDSAIRRRFQFVSLIPTKDPCDKILEKWLIKNSLPLTSSIILTKLNKKLSDHNMAIGPAYFMKSVNQTEKEIQRIWKFQILPLLEDHFYGQWDSRQEEFKFENFK